MITLPNSIRKLVLTLDMIKFQHSIFAMPFALVSLFYATEGQPGIKLFVLIVLAMITARNTAMSFNRIMDQDIDAKNPRTQNRPLVTGELSRRYAKIFCLVNIMIFFYTAAQFNSLTLWLSPLALLVVMGYSLTKRFTHYTQFFLGLSLGIAVPAAWIAARGELSLFPVLVGLGVLFWVAGFDLIYSTLDFDFDRHHDLKNLVVKLGIPRALGLARLLHTLTISCLASAGIILSAGPWYFFGVFVMGGFLIYEHRLVSPKDLSRVTAAFFTMNGFVGLTYFVFSFLDIYTR